MYRFLFTPHHENVKKSGWHFEKWSVSQSLILNCATDFGQILKQMIEFQNTLE